MDGPVFNKYTIVHQFGSINIITGPAELMTIILYIYSIMKDNIQGYIKIPIYGTKENQMAITVDDYNLNMMMEICSYIKIFHQTIIEYIYVEDECRLVISNDALNDKWIILCDKRIFNIFKYNLSKIDSNTIYGCVMESYNDSVSYIRVEYRCSGVTLDDIVKKCKDAIDCVKHLQTLP